MTLPSVSSTKDFGSTMSNV